MISSGPRMVLDNSLVMYFDAGNSESYSGSGSTWRNLISNGINGTLQGSPTYSFDNVGYFTLNGSGQYISTTHAVNYTSGLSVGMWVFINSTQVASNPMLASKSSSNAITQSDFPFYWTCGSTASTLGIGTGSDFVGFSVAGASHGRSNSWAYMTATYSTSALTVYVNGSQIGRTAISATMSSNSQNWTFCRAAQEYAQPTNFSCFTGRVSNIQFYSKTLAADEVNQNFVALRGRYGLG
jgi:hypothetical protein